MIIAFIIHLLGAGLAQAPSSTLYGNVVPRDAATFSWKGDVVAVRAGKAWISDLEDLAPSDGVEVIRDTPWTAQGAQRVLARSLEDAEREYENRRRVRLREGWEAAGYKPMVQANGTEVFVRQADLEVAREAERKERELLAKWHPAKATTAETVTVPAAEVVESPGFLKQWGGHVVLVLAAAGLVGLVVKMLVLEN